MPIVSDGRPDTFDALTFACLLSIWQFVFAIPGFLHERSRVSPGRPSIPKSAYSRRRMILVVLLTGVIFGLSTFMYVEGVERAGTVSFAIAVQAYPVFAILWESLFLGKRKSGRELMFTGLMIAALYYLGTGGTWRIDGFSIWFLFALGVPFLWSVAHVSLREVIVATGVTPHQIVFSRLLISTIFLLVVALVSNGPAVLVQAAGDGRFQAFALLMGFVYYLELINWFYAVRHIDVSFASTITAPAPVVTMLFAMLFLGDSVAPYQVAAMGMVILSILGLIRAGTRDHRKPSSILPVRELLARTRHFNSRNPTP